MATYTAILTARKFLHSATGKAGAASSLGAQHSLCSGCLTRRFFAHLCFMGDPWPSRGRPIASLPRADASPSLCLPPQYSFSLTTFSPSGKLVQIEYALAAVNAGATSLGIKATNGVVIATERKVRPLRLRPHQVDAWCTRQ